MEINRWVSIPEHIREAMGKAELSGKHRLVWQIRTEFQPGFKMPEGHATEGGLPADVRFLLDRTDEKVKRAGRRFERLARQLERGIFSSEQAYSRMEQALNAKFKWQIEAEAIRVEYNLKPKYPSARKVVEERKRSVK